MGDCILSLDFGGAQHLDAAERALADAAVSLPGDFTKVIRDAAEVLAAKARARILEEPVFRDKQTGLRAVIAAGVAVEPIDGGAHISTSMPESDEAILPRGFDDGAEGWRHPVFGRPTPWVHQRGTFSWFMDSMQSGQEDIQNGLQQVLEDTARRIAAATEA